MAKLLGIYKNGNYFVEIYDDGTKIRYTSENIFKPEFPESIDITITNKCDNNCKFCYMSCTVDGNHADLLSDEVKDIINTIHPFTELALNGNDLTHPQLVPFLELLKEKKIIANLTVNQNHFEKNIDFLKDLVNKKLIYGLGVSLVNPTNLFIDLIKEFDNAVIHTVNGLLTEEQLNKLSNNNLKLLVLGYKSKGLGKSYLKNHPQITDNMIWLRDNIQNYFKYFKIISFDNLALLQLDIENKISKEKWKECYMGDEGQFTMFMDLVNKNFAVSSLEEEYFPLYKDIKCMFKQVREKVKWQKIV